MDNFYTHSFQKLRKLKQTIVEQRQVFEEARHELESAKSRFNSLESYLHAEIELSKDPELRAALDEILNEPNYLLTIEYMSASQYPEQVKGFNKTQLLVRLLLDENNEGRGVTPKGLYLLAQKFDEGKEISLAYSNNILSRFNQLGRVEQIDGKYWLTNVGREWWKNKTEK